VAESDEARYTLYLSDVDTIEDLGNSRIILKGNTLAVRFNNPYLLHEQLLLKVNAEQHLGSLDKSPSGGKAFLG